MFSKICVNGDDAHPLWKWMKVQPKGRGILGKCVGGWGGGRDGGAWRASRVATGFLMTPRCFPSAIKWNFTKVRGGWEVGVGGQDRVQGQLLSPGPLSTQLQLSALAPAGRQVGGCLLVPSAPGSSTPPHPPHPPPPPPTPRPAGALR